jgi:hypothetical protein
MSGRNHDSTNGQGWQRWQRQILPGVRRLVVAGAGLVGLIGGVAFAGGASAGSVVPVAGTVSLLSPSLGTGPARNVAQTPTGLAVTADGTVDVADGEGLLRSMTANSGDESWIAGSAEGSTADGVRAVAASFGGGGFSEESELSIAVDPSGDIFVAEPEEEVVRVLAASTGTRYGIAMTRGRVYTVAGVYKSAGAFTRGGTPATSTDLQEPSAVAVDAAGNLVIANAGDEDVLVVAATTGRHYGQSMTVGHIYNVAGTGTNGLATSGTPGTTTELSYPDGLTFTPQGLAISSTRGSQVVVLATAAGSEYGVAMPTVGDIYPVINASGTIGAPVSGGPGPTNEMEAPKGLATDAAGDLYVADDNTHEVDVLAATTHTILTTRATAGDLYVVAGTGAGGDTGNNGPATRAEMETPVTVAVDPDGNLLIGDENLNNVILVADSTERAYGQAETAGHLYYVAGDGLVSSSGSGEQAVKAENNSPIYDAVSPDGDVAFADAGFLDGDDDAPRQGAGTGSDPASAPYFAPAPYAASAALEGAPAVAATPALSRPDGPGETTGRIRVIAGRTETAFDIRMVAGGLYTVAGGGVPTGGNPDGQIATQWGFDEPEGAAYDAHGNLIVTDYRGGLVEVVAAVTGHFYGQSMEAGHVYTIAGVAEPQERNPHGSDVRRLATQTSVEGPGPVAVDSHGNVLVGLVGDDEVDVIAAETGTFYGQAMTAGDLYVIAGTGTAGDTGDGGAATAADIGRPYGVAVDAAGDVVIDSTADNEPDQGGSTLRFVAGAAGTHFGQAMTAGDIYAVAGGGTAVAPGYGNGGPATSAAILEPGGVAFTATGGLVFGDVGADEIRMVPAAAGTNYGVRMVADHIYAVAGDGRPGRTAAPRAGTATSVTEPYGVAVAPSGAVVFTEEFAGVIGSLAG